ncbi:MAG: pimeloyl-[acyl-carrier protein] methyl ester esterase [Thiomicrorhabdus sp.]|nr:MAG: pimeloyl-[acyl-carrier protein] methyl ester esterase [Thiomicrorhabdus sp.]
MLNTELNAKLNSEKFGKGPSLTLIHGWGAQNSFWKQWAEETLAPFFTVHLIELPGFGYSKSLKLDSPTDMQLESAWLEAIEAVLPKKTHLLGWSLGGLLAQKIALNYPQKIDKLICMATSPRFTQCDQWQYGVSPELISDFVKAIKQDKAATLKHFWKLQLQGTEGARPLIKQLMTQVKESKLPILAGLLQGLQLLSSIDCRPRATEVKSPTLWLLGENDPLIPINFIEAFLAENSTIQPISHIEILTGAGHMPFRSHPIETAQKIIAFLNKDP